MLPFLSTDINLNRKYSNELDEQICEGDHGYSDISLEIEKIEIKVWILKEVSKLDFGFCDKTGDFKGEMQRNRQ